jgi:hypothetical protein
MSVGFRLRRHLVFLRHLFWEAYRERILVSIVATIVFATLISILNKIFYGHVIWERFYTESDAGTFFCEYTDMNKLIRQPVNTVTNFVYFVIAIYCFSKGMEDIKKDRAYNLITANRFYSFTLAAVMLYTFIGSTLFHSSLIEFFSKMDTNIRRSKERFFLIGIFSLIYLILSFNLDMSVVHPAVASIIVLIILTGVYLERKRPGQTNKNYLIACIVSILLAGLFFELDIKKIFCSDMGRISPHSLWHIFNGLSIFFFYLYIRSENYDASQDKLRLKLMERATLRVTKSK